MAADSSERGWWRAAVVVGALALVVSRLPVGTAKAQSAVPHRIGFSVSEPDTRGADGKRTVAISYAGPIAYPMAANLKDLLSEWKSRADRIVLDLDSAGGSVGEAEAASALLVQARQTVDLHTRVSQGGRCLSSCVLVFMQGAQRIAGSASVWLFHGACSFASNVPNADATGRFVDKLRAAGVSPAFLEMLRCGGHLSEPGKFWASGYQLDKVFSAGIITRLLPDWQPEPAVTPPFDPNVRAR